MGADTLPKAAGAILMYHRVASHDRPHELSVSPCTFKRHMQALRESGFPLLRLPVMARALESASLPPKSVAVTLDDGYLDGLSCAAGILTGCSVPATFFITTAPLQGEYEFWWDTLDRVFAAQPLPRHLHITLPFAAFDLSTTGAEAAVEAHRLIREVCYELAVDSRERLVSQLVAWSGVPRSVLGSSARPMTTPEVQRLAGIEGIDIGAHSVNHLRLPSRPVDERRTEIAESKTRLETVLGTSISSFSYPYGGVDAVTQDLVRQAGFSEAVTTEERSVTTGDSAFALPRFSIGDWDDRRFEAFLQQIFASGPRRDAAAPADAHDHVGDALS